MSNRNKYRRTRLEIAVQGVDQDACSFRDDLQKMMDEVNLRPSTIQHAVCFPCASSTGRMTAMIQWLEWSDKPKKKTLSPRNRSIIRKAKKNSPFKKGSK